MKKRVLSLMIAAVMILGMMPLGAISAFAEVGPAVVTTEQELQEALGAELPEIELGADIALTDSISLGYSYTLDLAGYTISTAEEFEQVDVFGSLAEGVTVTFTDSSEEQTGKILSSHTGDSVFWLSNSSSTVVFENLTIEHTGELEYGSIYIYNVLVVLKNCSIDSVYVESGSTGHVEMDDQTTSGLWVLHVGARLNVDPTEFVGFASDRYEAVLDEETGLWVVQLRTDIPPVAWADENDNGEVDEGEPVFHTLYDALNTSGSVKMADDYDARMEGDINIDSGEFFEVTLDLNGKSILTDTDYFFDIYNASLTVKDSSPEKSGRLESISESGKLAYVNNDESMLLVEGGTWSTTGTSICVDLGNCTITGGVFQSTDFDLMVYDGTVEISGGSFYHDITEYLADGATATYNEDTSMWDVAPVDALICSANLSLGNDLSVNYYVQINNSSLMDLSESFSMKFTLNGKITVVTDYTVEDGYYVFNFAGIAPQQLTDNIFAEFLIGEEIYAAIEEFSVRTYLDRLVDQYGKSELLVQLVTELIAYGTAAQEYKDYHLDRLADEGFDAIYSDMLPEKSDKALTKSLSQSVNFTTATVWFDTVNKIVVEFSTDENVTLKVNGEEVELDGTAFYTDGIYATDFDKVYTFELYENGVLVQTLTYSVNSYVYSMMDKTENGELTEMALLARSLYRYGLFAKWVAELPVPTAVEITDWDAEGYSYDGNTATYDAEIGWTPVLDEESLYDFFTLHLYAGDTVYFELSDPSSDVGLFDFDASEGCFFGEYDPSVQKVGMITVEADGTYTFYTTAELTARAWVVYNESAYEDSFDDSTGDVEGIPEEDYAAIPDGEVTDENERLTETPSFANGSYDSENGWSATEFDSDGALYGYFSIQLNSGDHLHYEFSEAVSFVSLYSVEIANGDFVGEPDGERTITSGVLSPIDTGVYEFYTDTPNVSVRVWFENAVDPDDSEEEPGALLIEDNVEIPEDLHELTDADEDRFIQLPVSMAGYDAQTDWTPIEMENAMGSIDGTSYYFFVPVLLEGEELYLEFSEETQYFINTQTEAEPISGDAAKTVKITGNGEVFVIFASSNVTMRAYLDGYDFEEITDENTQAAYEGIETATYDPELGWTPVLGTQYQYYSFVIDLEEGDVVRYLLETPDASATLYSFNLESVARPIGSNAFMVSESGTYWFSTDTDVNVKAWVSRAEPEFSGNTEFIPV